MTSSGCIRLNATTYQSTDRRPEWQGFVVEPRHWPHLRVRDSLGGLAATDKPGEQTKGQAALRTQNWRPIR